MLSITRVIIAVICLTPAWNAQAEITPAAEATAPRAGSEGPGGLAEYIDSLKDRTASAFQVAQAQGGQPILDFELREKPEEAPDIFDHPVFNQYVNLDFKNADIQNVIRLISKRTGLNILLNPNEVTGKITLSLENVRLGYALENILKVNKLGYIIDGGNIIRIVPERMVGGGKIETVTEMLELNWRNASDVHRTFAPFLTEYGTMQHNEETQILIITDVPPNVEKIKSLIRQMDRPDRQVVIEARLIDVQVDASRAFTAEWSMAKVNRDFGISAANLSGSLLEPFDFINPFSTVGGASAVALEGIGASGGLGTVQFGSVIGVLGDSYNINATLTAFEQMGIVEVLANPRVTTLNNVNAQIKIIQQIPYIEAVQGPNSNSTVAEVEFEEAGVNINVRPVITPDGHVRLDIGLEQRIFRGRVPVSSGEAADNAFAPPIIDVRFTRTTVLVLDQHTAVLGGLRSQRISESRNAVPWLSRVPVIGWAFKDKSNERSKTELILMVTPRIVEEATINDNEKRQYDRIDELWHLPDYYFDDVETPLSRRNPGEADHPEWLTDN